MMDALRYYLGFDNTNSVKILTQCAALPLSSIVITVSSPTNIMGGSSPQ